MSTSHISSQSRRSSQIRSLSPNGMTSNDDSHRKTAKSERHTDCKTESETQTDSNTNSNSETEHDCPAFRLRPRRSTPKPTNPSPGKRFSPFTAMMNRLKYLKDGSVVKRKLMFNKQKVYPSTFNSEELISNSRIIPPRSPSCSITEDIFVSPFVQKISPLELEADKEYGANYLSLKIIFKEDIEVNNERMLKLIATDVDIDDNEASTSTDIKGVNKKIAIYLYGSYINCRAEKNKVINIVKFITQSKLEQFDETNDGDFDFAIVVKSSDDKWVPFVSITTKWKAPEDPRELNRTLFLTPPDEKPKPEVSSNSPKK